MSSLPAEIALEQESPAADRRAILAALERKVLWLSSWTIHNANHLRPSRDGLKVGGHQASCASINAMMAALYFDVLRPEDRVAVKPHAAPVFHAIQYLFGHESRERLERFRSLGGAQSYPSRTKDDDDVDFSTGSVGLGAAQTVFSALARDYLACKGLIDGDSGRMIALVGDAELDEGNVFEALLESWKHDVRNLWWVVDYNRQSLDSVVSDRLFGRIDELFRSVGWRVLTLKHGRLQEAAFAEPGGETLRRWIDDCPNSLYSALTFKGGAGWRERLMQDFAGDGDARALVKRRDDRALHALMTNLAGNDIDMLLDAFHGIDDDRPTCLICYTTKGYGLPFAGHKDNHAGLMTPEQMEIFRAEMGVAPGEEWDRFAGLDIPADALEAFLADVPFAAGFPRRHAAPRIELPARIDPPDRARIATQDGFGRILSDIGREGGPLAERIVTASPDVAVSTNLGAWVNRRGIFSRNAAADTYAEEDVLSPQRWVMSPAGQHVELGIAENNLFLTLSAFGLSGPLFGERLLPIGTLYDPFIRRGLDALHHACYQDARFMLVATPSGITLAPEGGAHQSQETPLITLGQAGLAAFEPAFVDELAEIMGWGFRHMQADEGGSVALRLSTRAIRQPAGEARAAEDWRAGAIRGAYWRAGPSCDGASLVVAYMGAMAPEAEAAVEALREDVPDVRLLAITSPDRLHEDWIRARQARVAGDRQKTAPIERLLGTLAPDAAIVTVLDGHPAALSWLGSVAGHRIYPLGVDSFGQSGDIPDLHATYRIDVDAILDAAARAAIRRYRPPPTN